MIDWIAVVRRLFAAYKVKTQSELGMALGMPVDFGSDPDLAERGINWMILDKAVCEKNVGWDWLMTGEGDPPEGVDNPPEEEKAFHESRRRDAESVPRIETRELARQLLGPEEEARRYSRDYRPDEMARELEDIKSTMEREIDKVNKILGE